MSDLLKNIKTRIEAVKCEEHGISPEVTIKGDTIKFTGHCEGHEKTLESQYENIVNEETDKYVNKGIDDALGGIKI